MNPTYKRAIDWLVNGEPAMETEEGADAVRLIAALFGKSEKRVVRDAQRLHQRQEDQSAAEVLIHHHPHEEE